MFRWFSKSAKSSSNTYNEKDNQSTVSQEDFKGLQRSLRKLSTGIEEHIDALRGFDERVEEVKGIATIQESAWIGVLDRLYQVHEALRSEDHRLAGELLVELTEIEGLARLTPIAEYECSIDPTECQAVATVDVEESEHGMVQSIVRQGYRRPNGSLVREAVVILGRSNGVIRNDTTRKLDIKEVSNG
jgi:hypothetical protein